MAIFGLDRYSGYPVHRNQFVDWAFAHATIQLVKNDETRDIQSEVFVNDWINWTESRPAFNIITDWFDMI